MKGRYQNLNPWLKVLQWLSVIVAMMLILIVGIVVWNLCNGGNTELLHTVPAQKCLQALSQIALLFVPPIVLAYWWSTKPSEWLHLNRIPNIGMTLAAMLLMALASPLINMLSAWNQQLELPSCMAGIEQWMKQMEETATALTELLIRADSTGMLLFNIFLMAVIPAISEELTFRGMLQGLLTTQKHTIPHVAIWITAIIFSAIHCQFYGFIPRMLLGALFGYMVAWTGSLWIPILMHFTNNAIAVIGYNVVKHNGLDEELLESLGTGDTLWLGFLSALVVVVGVWLFYRHTVSKRG